MDGDRLIMRSSINKINGQYIGDSKLFDDIGIHTSNKNYNRMLSTEWIRPSEWLDFPDLTGITQTIVGLLALIPGFSAGHTGITSNSNFVAFYCQGDYSVNWGDGASNTYASGVVASKQYNYYSLPESNFTAEGYKQVFVRITPQTGQTLTAFFLNQKPVISGVTFPNGGPCNFLEIKLKTPFLNNSASPTSSAMRYPLLKNIEFLTPTPSFNTALHRENPNLENMGGLHFLEGLNSAQFENNFSVKAIPFWPSRSITGIRFQGNYPLKYVPPIHYGTATTLANAFLDTPALTTLPYLDTRSVASLLQTHVRNYSLRRLPDYNTANVTTMNSAFNSCSSLQTLPTLNTSNVIDFSNMLSVASSLREIQPFDTTKGITTTAFLQSCSRLFTIPSFTFTNARTINSCFAGTNAWKIDVLNGGTGVTNYFQIYSASFVVVAGISAAGGTLAGVTFFNSSNNPPPALYPQSTRVGPVYNVGRNINVTNSHFSPTALNEIFNSLATLSGVCATINISNNWGSSGCDRTIATAKGWTVTG